MDLHKTGSSHITKLLTKFLDGQKVGQHNIPTMDMIVDQEKFFLGSIRSPWDWYLSLWSFGCMKKGEIYHTTTAPAKIQSTAKDAESNHTNRSLDDKLIKKNQHIKEWKEVYSDSDNPTLFQRWLQMIHDPEYFQDVNYNYSLCSINKFIGFFTWRYIRLYCQNANFKNLERLNSKSKLLKFDQKTCYINKFIRNESLVEDCIETLRCLDVNISLEDQDKLYSLERTNKSLRNHPTQFYYDKKSIQLISKRDVLIIDKFKYKFN